MINQQAFTAHMKTVVTYYRGLPHIRRPTIIEQAEVWRNDTDRCKALVLAVGGYQADGSGKPVRIDQRRIGRNIFVEIYRDWDVDDICPAMIMPYQTTLTLEGAFEPGAYTIHVNGHTLDVVVA